MDQRLGEPPDLFAIRAFWKALPHIDQQSAIAAAEYLYAVSMDRNVFRRCRR